MALDNTSHNTDEYYIGKGIVTIDPDLQDSWFDVGNVPEFEFTPAIEELAHNSSRAGIRSRDRTVVVETGGDLRMVMEEWTALNMSIILLGDITVTPGASTPDDDIHEIEMLTKSAYSAGVRFQGQNIVGPKWNFEFLKVDFIPSGSLNPISEEWGGIEVTGRLAAVNGVFGTARRLTNGTDPGFAA